MIVPCTTPAPSSVFRLGGEASAAYVHIAYAVNISFGYPTGTVFTNIVDASAAVGPMNLIAEQYVLYALGVATNGTHITAAVATASAFLAHANSVSELCVILGFYDGRAQLNLPPPLPYPTPDGTTLAANSSNIWSSPVAYPATGSPGAVAPANTGKLGTSYPDGTTVQITADGEISVNLPASTTTTVVSTAGAEKVYRMGSPPYGSAPANWETPGFSDAGWMASLAETISETPYYTPPSGAAWVSDYSANPPSFEDRFLLRRHFTLPAGLVISATLSLTCDDQLNAAYLNGTALSGLGLGHATSGSPPHGPVSITLPASALTTAGGNVLALDVQDGNLVGTSPAAVAYKLVITQSSIGAGETIQHNGTTVDTQPIIDFEDPAFTLTDDAANYRVQVSLNPFVASGGSHAAGIVPDPGSSAGSTKYLREDATWHVPPGSGFTNPMTTTGDVIYSSDNSGTAARLGVGAAGQVLTVAGGVPVWGAAGAGSGGALTLIAETVVGVGGVASVTFSGISGSYRNLILRWSVRTALAATQDYLRLRLNSDTGAHYDTIEWTVYGSTPNDQAVLTANATSAPVGYVAGDTARASAAGVGVLVIPNYARAVWEKSWHANVYYEDAASTAATSMVVSIWGGSWHDASAVTDLTILTNSGSNIKQNSVLTLYGES